MVMQGMLTDCTVDTGMDSQQGSSYMRKQCSQGYYGPLCSMCLKQAEDGTSYGRTNIWNCQRCKRGVAIVAAFIASNLLVLVFLWYSIHAALKDNEEDLANIGGRLKVSEVTRVRLARSPTQAHVPDDPACNINFLCLRYIFHVQVRS